MLCPKYKITFKIWDLFVCVRIYLSSFAVRPGQNGLHFSHPCLHHVCGWYHVLRRLASQKTFIWHSNVTAKRGTPEFFMVGFFFVCFELFHLRERDLNLLGITQGFSKFLPVRTWTFLSIDAEQRQQTTIFFEEEYHTRLFDGCWSFASRQAQSSFI